jgi:hypothetical protein
MLAVGRNPSGSFAIRRHTHSLADGHPDSEFSFSRGRPFFGDLARRRRRISRQAGEPFIWVPDYSGRYTILPDYNVIRLVCESGIHSPRDFSGDGNFTIEDKKLVLRNLWLGTYKAKQKPDICEMTFKLTNEPVPAA